MKVQSWQRSSNDFMFRENSPARGVSSKTRLGKDGNLSKLSEIKRLSILAELIKKYCFDLGILEIVKLAKELAGVIDELNFYKIDLKKLTDDFVLFFPEHWKKRTQFLLIVTKYWPEILKENGKEQVVPNKSAYHASDFQCLTKDLRLQLSPKDIKNTVRIFEAEDLLGEIDFVINVVKNNSGKTIAIVSPNKDFSALLSYRFENEGIDYTSYVSNSFKELSAEFLNEIDGNFKDVSKEEKPRLIKELSSLAEVVKIQKNVSIVSVGDIKFLTSDIILLSELNEKFWSPRDGGEYWLHKFLRRKIGLTASTKNTMEDDFYSCFNGTSEIYLTRAKKINGIGEGKSSILSKFEAVYKKNDVKLDRIADCSQNYCFISSNSFEIKKEFLKSPNEITTGDVELLMKEPQGFYAKNILNLRPVEVENDKREFVIAFKNFMRSYFCDKSQATAWLNVIKNIDFFGYQKCLKVMEWLKKRNFMGMSYNDIPGRMSFPRFDITIRGRCDRVEEEGDVSRLIMYKTTVSQSTKDIIYGDDSSIMTTCLIAEKGGFEDIKLPIREIQIWSLSEPVDVKSIEISRDLIDHFELRLNEALECDYMNYQNNNKLRYDKYKHFKRV
ncbi:MAG: hypothetical protein LBM19_04615 [Holosporales bacterium]|jgi:hypothetical protein|nr:hypothetical protein [Holosporales bacterium]